MTKHRALTDRDVKSAQPGDKLNDGRGLLLLVRPNGRKVWALRFSRSGKDSSTVLGTYPDTSLPAARKLAEDKRASLGNEKANGGDAPTLDDAIEQWFAARSTAWTENYSSDVYDRLTKNVGELGKRRVSQIRAPDVLAVCTKITDRGSIVQAKRVRALLSQVFDYCLLQEWLVANPAPKAILKALPSRKVENFAAAPFEQMSQVYAAATQWPGVTVSAALRFLILTAARTTEVLNATWEEVDLEKAMWTVPANRMKAKRDHVVPLPTAAVQLLTDMPRLSDRWLFPSMRGDDRPLSNAALLAAVRAMGFDFTVHGFRSTFSTWANDTRAADIDIIEAALSHVVPGVRGAYDRGVRLDARRALMEKWAEATSNT